VSGPCQTGDVSGCAAIVAEWVALVDAELGPAPSVPAPSVPAGPYYPKAPAAPAAGKVGQAGLDPVGLVAIGAIALGLWWWFRK
jgi:hypothetical protein